MMVPLLKGYLLRQQGFNPGDADEIAAFEAPDIDSPPADYVPAGQKLADSGEPELEPLGQATSPIDVPPPPAWQDPQTMLAPPSAGGATDSDLEVAESRDASSRARHGMAEGIKGIIGGLNAQPYQSKKFDGPSAVTSLQTKDALDRRKVADYLAREKFNSGERKNASDARLAFDKLEAAKAANAAKAKTDSDNEGWERDYKNRSLTQRAEGAAATRALAGAVRGDKLEDKSYERVGKVSSELGDVEDMKQKLDDVFATIEKNKGGDLPGAGPVDAFVADKVPALAPQEGLDLRNNAKLLVNRLLKIQSGAGVSEGERARQDALMGVALGGTEDQFRSAMTRLRRDTAVAVAAKMRGLKPDEVDLYRKQGGMMPEDVDPSVSSRGKTQGAQPTPATKVVNGVTWRLVDPAKDEWEADE